MNYYLVQFSNRPETRQWISAHTASIAKNILALVHGLTTTQNVIVLQVHAPRTHKAESHLTR